MANDKYPRIMLNPFPHHLNSRLLEEFQGRLVRVGVLIDHLSHTRIDHHLGAEDAGLVGAV